MGRQTPLYMIQRQLEYAQKRQTYYASTTRPVKGTRDASPRQLVSYIPLFLKVGTTYPKIKLNASEGAVTEFGLTALGLSTAAADLADSQNAPRGFKPSRVHLTKGDATPTVQTAAGSGRRYIKYSASTSGTTQAHYSAPVSANNATPTVDEIETKVAAIGTAKAGVIGDYGRLWLELERYPSTFA